MQGNLSTNGRASALTMIAAMAVIGIIDNYISRIAEFLSIWQFLAVRAVFAIPFVALLSFFGVGSLQPKRLWAVFVRSLLIAMAMLFYFSSLSLLSMAQGLAGLFTSPIFVLLISILLLRQRIGPIRIVAVGIGFLGIILVLELDFMRLTWLSILPIFGGIFYAAGSVATRQLSEGESTSSMLLMLLCIQFTMGSVALYYISLTPAEVLPGVEGYLSRGWVWPIHDAVGYIILQAFGSVIGIGLIIRAYQIGEASYVAVYEYSIFIFAPLYAWIVFSEALTAAQFTGICLIAAAGVLIALRSS